MSIILFKFGTHVPVLPTNIRLFYALLPSLTHGVLGFWGFGFRV